MLTIARVIIGVLPIVKSSPVTNKMNKIPMYQLLRIPSTNNQAIHTIHAMAVASPVPNGSALNPPNLCNPYCDIFTVSVSPGSKTDIAKIPIIIMVKNKIENFFKEIKEKSPLEIKKIKKIAMNKRISLGENKKLFCKKCFFPFVNPKIRIKKGFKIITCEECGAIKRIKIK